MQVAYQNNNSSNRKLQIKIAKQKTYTEEREKERDFTILVEVTGLLQFYKFLIISGIAGGKVTNSFV